MPVARPTVIPIVCEWIIEHRPKQILDIGIGFGLWGFLCRNYGVIWDKDLTDSKYLNWKDEITIDGIEISRFLITPLQKALYNNIFIGDMREIIPKLIRNYDLIIMGDSLEHISKEDGLELIRILRKKGTLIITTPDYWNEGKAIMDNEHEKHQCYWKDEDFESSPRIEHVGNQKVVIYDKS